MTASSSPAAPSPAPAFVHLGERLLAIERVKAGEMTAGEAARALRVPTEQVREWQRIYAGDRTVTFGELRLRAQGDKGSLVRRARTLAALVVAAEKVLRGLHVELIRASGTSTDHTNQGCS